MSMVGRVYVLRGEYWRVVCRWAPLGGEPRTRACRSCGRVVLGRVPVECCGLLMQSFPGPPRNVLLERVVECYRDDDCAMHKCPCRATGWRPTGERIVRPFRGLRRA